MWSSSEQFPDIWPFGGISLPGMDIGIYYKSNIPCNHCVYNWNDGCLITDSK